MTIAAPEPFLVYVFFVAEEDGSGVFWSECNITASNFLSEGAHREQDAYHDGRNEQQSFHVHHPLSDFL